MIRQPGSLGPLHEGLQAPQMLAVWFFRRPEIHGYAVLHHAVLIENLIEDVERASAINHVILRDDFEPINHWLFRKDVLIVRSPQTDTYSVLRESIEPISRHRTTLLLEVNAEEGLGRAGSPAALAPPL